MNVEDDIKTLTVPPELREFIGDYHKALIKRADMDLVGESEYRCFKRFLQKHEKPIFAVWEHQNLHT